jgi:hypothetical protein
MAKGNRVLTPVFRVSFPNVFKAVAFQEGQDPKYSLTMLFPKNMSKEELAKFAAMKNLVEEAVKDKWGDKVPRNLRSPFRDGSEKDFPGYENVVFCSASSKQKPSVVNEDAEPIMESSDFYPGCYAQAYLTAFAYDTAGNRGVAFGLSTVQKVKNGEPFVSRHDGKDDFAPVAKEESERPSAMDVDSLFGNKK